MSAEIIDNTIKIRRYNKLGSRISRLNRRFNSYMFLFTSGLFMFLSAAHYAGYNTKLLRDISSVCLLGTVVIVNYTMPRKQYFKSKAVYVLMFGACAWMAWYIFTYVTGLVEVTDFRAAYKITARVALTAIFFLGARITIAYDLKIYFLGVALIATGSILALNYLRFFDGLNFISRIGSLLLANGRYRNAYGFTHPNDAGIACCYFIIISLLYNMALETRTRNQYKNILMSQYIYILCIITFLMMMSTGSRSAITSLAMFLMVYFLLGMYKKNAVTANALLVVSIILVAFFAMIAIDWYFLIIQSGRLQNFMPIMKMSADELITGYGYIDYLGEGFLKWGSKLGFGKYLDSMYANVIISSGIVGFCLFFIPLTLSIMMFFRNVREMTKLQRAIGASFVQVMYYFMFEQHLYDFMWYSLVIWIISIIIMNEKAQTIKNNVASFTIQTRRTKICNGLC